MNSTDQMKILDNRDRGRFEIKLEGDYAYVNYRLRNQVMELIYIFVPEPYRGKGVAEELIRYVLNDAVANNRKIIVYCSWIAGYVHSHPEYHSLLNK